MSWGHSHHTSAPPLVSPTSRVALFFDFWVGLVYQEKGLFRTISYLSNGPAWVCLVEMGLTPKSRDVWSGFTCHHSSQILPASGSLLLAPNSSTCWQAECQALLLRVALRQAFSAWSNRDTDQLQIYTPLLTAVSLIWPRRVPFFSQLNRKNWPQIQRAMYTYIFYFWAYIYPNCW